MKQEIKEQLLDRLRKSPEKQIGTSSYPVIKILAKILKENNPEVDFENLESKRDGNRPEAWDNILSYSGLNRFDFTIKDYSFDYIRKFRDKNKKEQKESVRGYIPKFTRGYKHPTIGSVIHDNFYLRKKRLTYGDIALIIENHYSADSPL